MKNKTEVNDRPALLFVVQLPPPLHGASLMNSIVTESELLRKNFRTEIVSLHFADSVQDLGKFSFGKIRKTLFYAVEIIKKIIRFKPDLVYVNLTPKGFAFYRDTFYVFIIKLLRRRIVFHLQSKGIRENVENSLTKRKLYQMVLANTSLICLSPMLSDDFDMVYRDEPYYIPNGIVRQAGDNTSIMRADVQNPEIMYLSHLLKSKGVLVLVDALEILRDEGFNFSARLIGPSADITVEELKRLIVSKGLDDRVEVTGPRYGDDKFTEFRQADIFVFPTYNEVFGLVILEAMQYSLPVVATIEGAIPDIIIDGKTGFLVEKQNAGMLADRLGRLLKDGELRRIMGKEGHRRFLENYTIDKFESNILFTLQTILNKTV